jgi:hypothetical protein
MANAFVSVQNMIKNISKDTSDLYIVIYIDDILIYSQKKKKQKKNIKEVLNDF